MTYIVVECEKMVESVRQNDCIFLFNIWFSFIDTFYGLVTAIKHLRKLVDNNGCCTYQTFHGHWNYDGGSGLYDSGKTNNKKE